MLRLLGVEGGFAAVAITVVGFGDGLVDLGDEALHFLVIFVILTDCVAKLLHKTL